ncbi:MAG: phasin family protein [Steroidobacteraceae bacterium]
MMNRIKDFVTEQSQAVAEQARKLRKEPVQVAREAAVKSAERIKSLQDPVRALSRPGVKLTAISQGTAQSLIELQAQIVTSALTEAAAQLERAARTDNVTDLVRDQAEVLRATRERIVSDISQAVAIFKDAGGDVRKVATQTYAKVAGKDEEVPVDAKAKRATRKAAKRPVRARKSTR